MKKVLVVLVLIMAVLVVNAQTTKPGTTKEMPARTTVVVGDLQKTITDNVTKDYAGYTIKEAAKVTEKNNVRYEVVVVKGTTTETLVYDNNGKYLRKLPATKKK